MITRLHLLLLFISLCFVGLGSSWNSEVVCFENGELDLSPIQPPDCSDLLARIATLPYLQTQLVWSSRARGPSRLPYFLRSGNCQLWFVPLPSYHGSFEQFALVEAVRSMMTVIRACLSPMYMSRGGPWGGYMDIGDFDQLRMSIVNHRYPPRRPERWPMQHTNPHNLSQSEGHEDEGRRLQAKNLC